MQVKFHLQTVGHVDVFYRVAGPADASVVLLLHGFPTASHMFRDLIPELDEKYRVIAPDLPLAMWGRHDSHFLPTGALAYQRDLPRAEIALLEAGHFALEAHAAEIGDAMRHFLAAHGAGQPQ